MIVNKFKFSSLLFTAIALVFFGSAYAQLIPGKDYPAEIENPECLGINKEPYHATLMPYASMEEALKGDRHKSSHFISLNGLWKF